MQAKKLGLPYDWEGIIRDTIIDFSNDTTNPVRYQLDSWWALCNYQKKCVAQSRIIIWKTVDFFFPCVTVSNYPNTSKHNGAGQINLQKDSKVKKEGKSMSYSMMFLYIVVKCVIINKL